MNYRAVVLVVGAGGMGSIGHAVAIQAAEAGFDVAVADIERPRSMVADVEIEAGWEGLGSVVREVEARGARALAVHCDVTNRSQVDAMVAAAEALGPLYGMVNTSRAPIATAVAALDEDDGYWQQSFAVNVHGALLCANAAARVMGLRARGSIVNVSSMASLHPVRGRTAYCASKAALNTLTRCLALDYAETGIRVNAVLPGIIATHRVDPEEREKARSLGLGHAAYRAQVLQAQGSLVPLGRVGTAQEVAATIGFLLSEGSAYVTGELIGVSGGALAPYGGHSPLGAADHAMGSAKTDVNQHG